MKQQAIVEYLSAESLSHLKS